MNDNQPLERGAASVKIELSKGVITVWHGTDNVILQQWVANTGDWEKLWQTIMALKLAGGEV